ncbi:enoyl-CoA hydratase [Massilia sp. W12]|uniref:enoyl-CoA hydratase n=1 Tax=Massilia sp. W12 TaxID=3126507 RepID=UPI0030CDD127
MHCPVFHPALQLQIEAECALLQLANPPANTFTLDALRALPALLQWLSAQSAVDVLIIHGAGGKFFSAGAELRSFAHEDAAQARAAGAAMAQAFNAAFSALAGYRGLSIAAINGYAMGGGLECALACDVRIVEEHAQLALPEAAVGLLPCAGGTQLLPWLVGEAWAKRMILLGERIDAGCAEQIGLAQRCARGAALQTARELAAQARRQSPDARAACKRLIHGARKGWLAGQLAQEQAAFLALFDGVNQAEGVQAFLQKRSPQWEYTAQQTRQEAA